METHRDEHSSGVNIAEPVAKIGNLPVFKKTEKKASKQNSVAQQAAYESHSEELSPKGKKYKKKAQPPVIDPNDKVASGEIDCELLLKPARKGQSSFSSKIVDDILYTDPHKYDLKFRVRRDVLEGQGPYTLHILLKQLKRSEKIDKIDDTSSKIQLAVFQGRKKAPCQRFNIITRSRPHAKKIEDAIVVENNEKAKILEKGPVLEFVYRICVKACSFHFAKSPFALSVICVKGGSNQLNLSVQSSNTTPLLPPFIARDGACDEELEFRGKESPCRNKPLRGFTIQQDNIIVQADTTEFYTFARKDEAKAALSGRWHDQGRKKRKKNTAKEASSTDDTSDSEDQFSRPSKRNRRQSKECVSPTTSEDISSNSPWSEQDEAECDSHTSELHDQYRQAYCYDRYEGNAIDEEADEDRSLSPAFWFTRDLTTPRGGDSPLIMQQPYDGCAPYPAVLVAGGADEEALTPSVTAECSPEPHLVPSMITMIHDDFISDSLLARDDTLVASSITEVPHGEGTCNQIVGQLDSCYHHDDDDDDDIETALTLDNILQKRNLAGKSQQVGGQPDATPVPNQLRDGELKLATEPGIFYDEHRQTAVVFFDE